MRRRAEGTARLDIQHSVDRGTSQLVIMLETAVGPATCVRRPGVASGAAPARPPADAQRDRPQKAHQMGNMQAVVQIRPRKVAFQ